MKKNLSKNSKWQSMVFVVIYLAMILFGVRFLLPDNVAVFISIVVTGLLILVCWHAKSFSYQCPGCGKKFEISLFVELFSPNYITRNGGVKYLHCPYCHTKGWFEIEEKRLKCKGWSSLKTLFR